MARGPLAELAPLEPGPITGHGQGVRESLPRATLLRTTDLLSLRLSFVDLVREEGPDGPVLRRADGARVGFLRVILAGQHLHEEAFFSSSGGVKARGDGSRPPDPDDRVPEPETAFRTPPVRARLAGASRVVLRVLDEQIPWTCEGILRALTGLRLSVPRQATPRAPAQDPLLDLIERFDVVGASTLLDRATTGRHAASVSGALHAVAAMRGSVTAVRSRFGTSAAAQAVLASHQGGGAFRLDADLLRRIELEPLPIETLLPTTPAPPTGIQTALELPWRLLLSPHAEAGFAHALEPVTSVTGWVELWHTRLGTRTDDGVDERPTDDRTVRAVWARDFDELAGFPFRSTPPGSGEEFPHADGSQDRPRFRAPLNSRDRMMLVHETANPKRPRTSGTAAYVPPPVDVEHLALSALGGSLRSRFTTRPPRNTTIEKWVHHATYGRDSFVEVVYAGYLLPFGHRASLVKVTERELHQGTAYLVQRMYVVVRQPVRDLGAGGRTVGGSRLDRAVPFSSVRLLTTTTPFINAPTDLTPSISGWMFVPTVDGVPFPFRMLAVDLDDRLVELEGPLAFVEKDHGDTDARLRAVVEAYANLGHAIHARGQKVAYAASVAAADTTLVTRQLRFDVVTSTGLRQRGGDAIGLEPVLRDASVVVPAMSALAGADAWVTVAYPSRYLADGFAGTTAEVFLDVVGGAKLDFSTQSDRSGGFVAPSIAVRSLSRSLGPMARTAAELAPGSGFDLRTYFDSSAKLFGLVGLGQLLPEGTVDQVPRFVAESLDAATMLISNIERVGVLAGRLAAAPGVDGAAAALQSLADAATSLLDGIVDLLADPDATAARSAATDLLGVAQAARSQLAAAEGLLRADREALESVLNRVTDVLSGAGDWIGQIAKVASGAPLPELVRARLDWHATLLPWPSAGDPIFEPVGDGSLTLAVDVQAPTAAGAPPSALVSCAVAPFDLHLIGKKNAFLHLQFERLEFSAVPGRKTDVNVVFRAPDGVVFGEPLAFVETLRSIIPLDGFSDPPYLDVRPSGIEAGFDVAIPTVAMGVFALSNVTFAAAFAVPFIGESIAVRFAFSSREDPFRLQVALFAGGGFFAVVITPSEVRELEAAFEFGAAVALNFGVASGSVSVMAGIYFRVLTQGGETSAQLAGYFRARGEVDVLGLIRACIEIYLELTYETASGKAVGRASISVEVSVALLSFSVSITCEKKFAGSSGDPTFAEVMGPWAGEPDLPRPWDEYCDAFAG
ncbi:hypothetical protein [Egicoccus sp. AB-alg6-2]|uniref:hypothetical protein n=1 Tax=Egicoccus sp. AB-alg6-2 TaxID=3242692 RepID=UPI00359DC731